MCLAVVAAAVLCALAAVRPTQAAAAGYTLTAHWGTRGSGAGELIAPKGIGVGKDGSVYVCDYANAVILKYTPDGVLLDTWGGEGTRPGRLRQPSRLAVSGDGSIYVTDSANYPVQRFSPGGRLLDVWGTKGSGPGQFLYPRGVAVDARGRVYVTDQGNGRVQVFTASGSFIRAFGRFGDGVGRLRAPKDVAISPRGRVYVADAESCDIEMFSASGLSLGRWGGKGTARGTFRWLRGLAIDGRGHIFVADTGNDRMQEFAPDRTFVREWGCAGKLPGQLSGPRDVAPAADGAVFVTDTYNARIERFTPSSRVDDTEPDTTADWGDPWLQPARRVTWTRLQASVAFTVDDPDGAPFTTYVRSGGESFHISEGPLELSRQGVHTIEFLSVDAAGNQEALHRRLLGIDWMAPRLSWAAGDRFAATRGSVLDLSFLIGDNLSPRCGLEVTVVRDETVISATRLGTVVSRATLRRVTRSFTCPERPGVYSLLLLARDRAKNARVIAASLTVR